MRGPLTSDQVERARQLIEDDQQSLGDVAAMLDVRIESLRRALSRPM